MLTLKNTQQYKGSLGNLCSQDGLASQGRGQGWRSEFHTWNQRWKERTVSTKVSSDLTFHSGTHTLEHALTYTQEYLFKNNNLTLWYTSVCLSESV